MTQQSDPNSKSTEDTPASELSPPPVPRKKRKEISVSTQRTIASFVILSIIFFSLVLIREEHIPGSQILQKHSSTLRGEKALTNLVLSSNSMQKKTLQSVVDSTTSFHGEAMFMPYKIILGEYINQEEWQTVHEIIETTFWDVHCTFNHFNKLSEISQINSLVALSPRKLSPECQHLFELAEHLHFLSCGKYDPTINNLREAWRIALDKGVLLSELELNELKDTVGWKHVDVNQQGELCKLHNELKFDFSSIAKGYAVDILANRLKEADFHSFLVEWAGETRVAGRHPSNRSWSVGVHNPVSAKNEQIALCEIDEGSIATSGHSEQYWIVGDENDTFHSYSHMINPRTLKPLRIADREILSCTVCAPTCALADGLATSGLLFDNLEEALEWSKAVKQEHADCDIYFLSRDGTLTSASENFTQKQHGKHKIYYNTLPSTCPKSKYSNR